MTKKIAQIMLGRLLQAARINLEGNVMNIGFKFLDARIEIGRDTNVPNTVEMKAIFIVSVIPIQAVEQVKSNGGYAVHTGYAWGSITPQSGGHSDSLMNTIRFCPPPDNLPQSLTNPSISQNDKASRTGIVIRVQLILTF
tara:strand:- start:335 stop:754 length:420 start_codon:yes stop_codon:yes gene_type:complete